MSVPKFPESDAIPSCEESISSIIMSIAMEEAALSHILNAEGEKLQHAIAACACNCDRGIEQLLKVNASVSALIDQITDLQIILKNKLCIATKFLPDTPSAHCFCEKTCCQVC